MAGSATKTVPTNANKGNKAVATAPERGTKSRRIREVLETNPNLGNKEIAEMITKEGIKCSSQDVANQKFRLTKDANNGQAGSSTRRGRGKRGVSNVPDFSNLRHIKTIINNNGGLDEFKQMVDRVNEAAKEAGGFDRLVVGVQSYAELVSPAEAAA